MLRKDYPCVMSLEELLVPMHIGVTEGERANKQDIKISFSLFFPEAPKACQTDALEDTECYHKIADVVRAYCASHEVKLLEFLCHELYQQVRSIIAAPVKLWVRVEKCNPPIEGLQGATSFEYSDV